MKLRLEEISAEEISKCFSYYLEHSHFKRSTFPGNNADLKRIEKNDRIFEYKFKNGEMIRASIITEGFIQSCLENFNCTKIDLMFGGEERLSVILRSIFYDIAKLAFTYDLDIGAEEGPEFEFKIDDRRDVMLQQIMCRLFSSSAEYSIKRQNLIDLKFASMPFYDYIDGNLCFFDHSFKPIDIVINHLDIILGVSIPFNEIFRFYWAAIKEEFINSFKLRIIECLVTVPIGSEKKPIKFHELSKRTEDWLYEDVANLIVPNLISKLEKNRVFALGYMVKGLVDSSSRLPKDYSNVETDSIINAEIIKKIYTTNYSYKEKYIKKEQIINENLFKRVREVNLEGNDLRVDYRLEKNKKGIDLLAKMSLGQLNSFCISLVINQKACFNSVGLGMERTIIDL